MTEPVVAGVAAREKWNFVATLEGGIEYQVQPIEGQTWVDWFTECGPEGYDRGFLKPFRWLRRHKTAPWFALIGVLGDGEPFEIGAGTRVTPDVTDALRCYANDIPWMYWNNKGSIDVSVMPAR